MELGWLTLADELRRHHAPLLKRREMLHRVVGERITGEKSRKNTVSVLEGFWRNPLATSNNVSLVNRERPDRHHREDQLPFIFGLGIGAYPFLGTVAAHVGRLIKLHDEARADQLRQRMADQFGDKRRIKVALQAALQTFCDWGLLSRVDNKYIATRTIEVDDPELSGWLLLNVMMAEGKRIALVGALRASPMLFPFHFRVPVASILTKCFPVDLTGAGPNQDLLEVHI